MYSLTDNNVIEVIECGPSPNFGYVLMEDGWFINTDYKVLTSQQNDNFVPCMKMSFNGKTELFYMVDDYKPLSTVIRNADSDAMIRIIVNLFEAILAVKENGFLSAQNIDLSWDRIFVDVTTYKVRLVYIPVNYKVFEGYPEYESELRSSLIKLTNSIITQPSDKLARLLQDLANASLSLRNVYYIARGYDLGATEPQSYNVEPPESVYSSNRPVATQNKIGLKLISMNLPKHLEIDINKDNLVLGRKEDYADVVIPGNTMISKRHCRISKTDGNYYLMDENSVNGTFINGYRLEPGKYYPFRKNDVIRLADSDFQVV